MKQFQCYYDIVITTQNLRLFHMYKVYRRFYEDYMGIPMLALSCMLMPIDIAIAKEDSHLKDNTSETRKILEGIGLLSNAYDIIDGEYIVVGTTKT